MAPSEVMGKLIDVLETRQIPYFITGSVASIAFGEPRFTNDLDVVVELSLNDVDNFCDSFSAPDYYCSRDAALMAVKERFQFNVIHLKSGYKIDVFVPVDNEFSRSCFARRVRVLGSDDREAWFSSPEDVILKKMDYYKIGKSEKHIRDIVGILKVQAEKIDRGYITTWADRMSLAEIWVAIMERAGIS